MSPMPAPPPVPEPELCSHEVPRPRKKKRRRAASAGTPVPNTPNGSVVVLDSEDSPPNDPPKLPKAEGAAAEATEAAPPQHTPKRKKPKQSKFKKLGENVIFADTLEKTEPAQDVSKGGAEATPHDVKPRGTTRKKGGDRRTQRASTTTFPETASGDQLEELVKQTLSALPPPNSATELDEAASAIMKAIAHTKIDKNEAQADRKDEYIGDPRMRDWE